MARASPQLHLVTVTYPLIMLLDCSSTQTFHLQDGDICQSVTHAFTHLPRNIYCRSPVCWAHSRHSINCSDDSKGRGSTGDMTRQASGGSGLWVTTYLRTHGGLREKSQKAQPLAQGPNNYSWSFFHMGVGCTCQGCRGPPPGDLSMVQEGVTEDGGEVAEQVKRNARI